MCRSFVTKSRTKTYLSANWCAWQRWKPQKFKVVLFLSLTDEDDKKRQCLFNQLPWQAQDNQPIINISQREAIFMRFFRQTHRRCGARRSNFWWFSLLLSALRFSFPHRWCYHYCYDGKIKSRWRKPFRCFLLLSSLLRQVLKRTPKKSGQETRR